MDHEVQSEGDKTGGKRRSYRVGNLFGIFFRGALGSLLKGSKQEDTPWCCNGNGLKVDWVQREEAESCRHIQVRVSAWVRMMAAEAGRCKRKKYG